MKMELSNVLLGKQQSTNNNNVLENNTNELKNIEQLNELKKMLYKLEAQGQFWQRNQQQTFSTINKL